MFGRPSHGAGETAYDDELRKCDEQIKQEQCTSGPVADVETAGLVIRAIRSRADFSIPANEFER